MQFLNTTASQANALAAFKKYGLAKQGVYDIAKTFFHFPQMYSDLLDEYQVLYWNGSHTYSMVNNGAISKLDKSKSHMIQYNVIYQSCTPETVKRARQVKLSFRKLKQDLGIPAMVLIRIVD